MSFKEESQVWIDEYPDLKSNLADEFKIADKTIGIIDHYSN